MANSEEPIYPITTQNLFGLTKEEYFVAMAMQGLCANPNLLDGQGNGMIDIADLASSIGKRTLAEMHE